MLARWFNLRGRMLQKGIRRMLEDDNKNFDFTITNAFIEIWFSLVRFFNPSYKSKSNFTKAFFNYPTIKYLSESKWNSKPAYINAVDFSSTLIYLLIGNNYDGLTPKINLLREALFSLKTFRPLNGPEISIDPDTLNHLQKTFLDANNDIDKFESALDGWFNNTMDRTTGWYKRQNRLMLFLIGFFLAINFNVDTIAIYKILAKDKTARENLVQLATVSVPKYKDLVKQLSDTSQILSAHQNSDTSYSAKKDTVIIKDTITRSIISKIPDSILETAKNTVMSDIDKANNIAGLGWPNKDSCKICDSLKQRLSCCSPDDTTKLKQLKNEIKKCNEKFHCDGNPYQEKGTMLVGWLLTAFAISLGASFWFDLLSKLISIKNNGNNSSGSITGDVSTSGTSNQNNSSTPKRVG